SVRPCSSGRLSQRAIAELTHLLAGIHPRAAGPSFARLRLYLPARLARAPLARRAAPVALLRPGTRLVGIAFVDLRADRLPVLGALGHIAGWGIEPGG